MNSLCIDVGSTFVKYFVFNTQSREVLHSNKASFPDPTLKSDILYEISSQEVLSLIFDIIKEVGGFNCERCFISVQMHGYVLRYSDGSFSNYISWKDRRGDISLSCLKDYSLAENGTSLKSNLPLIKILSDPPAGECEFFTLGSYIAYILTGTNCTHKTDACASGFFNAETLNPVALGNISLPEVTHSVRAVGKYRDMTVYTHP